LRVARLYLERQPSELHVEQNGPEKEDCAGAVLLLVVVRKEDAGRGSDRRGDHDQNDPSPKHAEEAMQVSAIGCGVGTHCDDKAQAGPASRGHVREPDIRRQTQARGPKAVPRTEDWTSRRPA
jgi:hypothetical protein